MNTLPCSTQVNQKRLDNRPNLCDKSNVQSMNIDWLAKVEKPVVALLARTARRKKTNTFQEIVPLGIAKGR